MKNITKKGVINMKKSLLLSILSFAFIVGLFVQTSFAAGPNGALFTHKYDKGISWATVNVIHGWATDSDMTTDIEGISTSGETEVRIYYWNGSSWVYGGNCYSNFPTDKRSGDNAFWCRTPNVKAGTMIRVKVMNRVKYKQKSFPYRVLYKNAKRGHKWIWKGSIRHVPEDEVEYTDQNPNIKVRAKTDLWIRPCSSNCGQTREMRATNKTWSYHPRNLGNVLKEIYYHRTIISVYANPWGNNSQRIKYTKHSYKYNTNSDYKWTPYFDYSYDKYKNTVRAYGYSYFKPASNSSYAYRMTTRDNKY